mgnify:CR=1 FL=1
MSVTIPAGRINRLFGTDGGVMLSLYADFPEEFDTGTPLLVTIDALEVPLYCERFERRGTSGAWPHSPISTPSAGLRNSSGLNSVSNATRTKTTNSTWKT